MIITTTPTIEGKDVTAYRGIVFGEIIIGMNFLKDFAAGLTNFFGGRSNTYEKGLVEAREGALKEMQERAVALGADGIIGVKIDYEVIGSNGNNMMMVIASGTAVKLS